MAQGREPTNIPLLCLSSLKFFQEDKSWDDEAVWNYEVVYADFVDNS